MDQVSCESTPTQGAERSMLFLVTVQGHQSGVSNMLQLLNTIPGYHVRDRTATAGWLHLSECADGLQNCTEWPNLDREAALAGRDRGGSAALALASHT